MGVLPDNPITEKVHSTPFQGTANILVAYPAFGDWVRLYDAQKLRDIKQNHALFADMRRNHERTVTEQLSLMVKKATGRAVFAEIGSNTAHSVTIVPFDFLPSDSWSVGTGAVTKAKRNRGAALVDVPMSGQTYEGKRYTSETIGKGTGSGSYIYFTARRHDGRETPDEVLLHELLHASRKVRGVVYRMPVSGSYGNLEEFLAVVVTNMYRSEKGRKHLQDYHGGMIDPATFLDTKLIPTPRLLLGTFKAKQPKLFAALAHIHTEFNPVRQVDREGKALIRKIEHA